MILLNILIDIPLNSQSTPLSTQVYHSLESYRQTSPLRTSPNCEPVKTADLVAPRGASEQAEPPRRRNRIDTREPSRELARLERRNERSSLKPGRTSRDRSDDRVRVNDSQRQKENRENCYDAGCAGSSAPGGRRNNGERLDTIGPSGQPRRDGIAGRRDVGLQLPLQRLPEEATETAVHGPSLAGKDRSRTCCRCSSCRR